MAAAEAAVINMLKVKTADQVAEQVAMVLKLVQEMLAVIPQLKVIMVL